MGWFGLGLGWNPSNPPPKDLGGVCCRVCHIVEALILSGSPSHIQVSWYSCPQNWVLQSELVSKAASLYCLGLVTGRRPADSSPGVD